MKALTRCLCPKPDYVVQLPTLAVFNWCDDELNHEEFNDNILHFKVATTECSRCGVPLCEECATWEKVWLASEWYYTQPLCPTCVEEGR